jgi:hypothetical protein
VLNDLRRQLRHELINALSVDDVGDVYAAARQDTLNAATADGFPLGEVFNVTVLIHFPPLFVVSNPVS